MAKNKLLFSTPQGGVQLRPGQTKVLTADHHHHHHHDHDHHRGIDVRDYEVIRVVADNRSTSVSCVIFTLTSLSDNGRPIGRLARFKLAPGESFSEAYVVPGRFLSIRAHAVRKNNRRGIDTIDVSVFGHK